MPRPRIADGLAHPGVAREQDGVFTRTQARESGWSDDRQRRLIRDELWVTVTAGVLRHREVPDGPWQRGRAVRLTGALVPSHATAGRLWGLRTSDELHGTRSFWRRSGAVRVHRDALDEHEVVDVGGLVLTGPLRTLADLLCWQLEPESVSMVTDAMREGILDPADLAQAAASAKGRFGAERARFVARTCAGRPFSPLEWRFQQAVRVLGPGWRFNVAVPDGRGGTVVVDALHEPTATIVELDGRAFHGPDRFQADRTRDQRLQAAGYAVLRFTWEDVDQRLQDVLEIVRRTIATRRQAPSRARP